MNALFDRALEQRPTAGAHLWWASEYHQGGTVVDRIGWLDEQAWGYLANAYSQGFTPGSKVAIVGGDYASYEVLPLESRQQLRDLLWDHSPTEVYLHCPDGEDVQFSLIW